ncbi:MAG TPA: hypothetical protein VJ969_10075, partial [Desulfopila sp.]|nr:hypothetical protein [Desulfopila sp.]
MPPENHPTIDYQFFRFTLSTHLQLDFYLSLKWAKGKLPGRRVLWYFKEEDLPVYSIFKQRTHARRETWQAI